MFVVTKCKISLVLIGGKFIHPDFEVTASALISTPSQLMDPIFVLTIAVMCVDFGDAAPKLSFRDAFLSYPWYEMPASLPVFIYPGC